MTEFIGNLIAAIEENTTAVRQIVEKLGRVVEMESAIFNAQGITIQRLAAANSLFYELKCELMGEHRAAIGALDEGLREHEERLQKLEQRLESPEPLSNWRR